MIASSSGARHKLLTLFFKKEIGLSRNKVISQPHFATIIEIIVIMVFANGVVGAIHRRGAVVAGIVVGIVAVGK